MGFVIKFRVACFVGDNYRLYTDLKYGYDQVWLRPTGQYVAFKAKTCRDVHVLLASDFLEQAAAYEVVIGGYNNQRVDIRRSMSGIILAQEMSPEICNCDEFLPFWVSWEDGIIEVGTGKVHQHVLVSFNVANIDPEVKAISLSTYYNPGEYLFPSDQCELK